MNYTVTNYYRWIINDFKASNASQASLQYSHCSLNFLKLHEFLITRWLKRFISPFDHIYLRSIHWTIWQRYYQLIYFKSNWILRQSYEYATRLGLAAYCNFEKPSSSGRQGHVPSTKMRGTTIFLRSAMLRVLVSWHIHSADEIY